MATSGGYDFRDYRRVPAEVNYYSDEGPNLSNYDNVMVWLNHQACGGTVKRKRRITQTQRSAANVRERRRMDQLNSAFEQLRQVVPATTHEKRLSRIQTLKQAIDYIAFMTNVLETDNQPVMQSVSNPHTDTADHQLQQDYCFGPRSC